MKIRSGIQKRKVRHRRVRARIRGTSERPRLSVYRSSKHLEAQLIDDRVAKTLWGLSDLAAKQRGTKTEKAERLGKLAAKKFLELGIEKIVFDRGGFAYHGRIKAFAEAMRKGGVIF